jgi:excisionase family DNA binding protein
MEQDKLLLKVSEAAQMIGVSRSKMYELIACGAVQSVRLQNGRLVRVPVSTLRKLAEPASVVTQNGSI